MHKAARTEEHEFHMVNGKLFITSESDPDQQVALSIEEVNVMLEYLYRVGVLQHDLIQPFNTRRTIGERRRPGVLSR